MYRLNQIKLNIYHNEEELHKKIAKTANVSVADIDWATLVILHKSIDARDKKNILFVYNVAFDFVGEGANHAGCNKSVGASLASPKIISAQKKLEKYEPIIFNPIILDSHNSPMRDIEPKISHIQGMGVKCNFVRPIVVGFGPAGIFASYILALNDLKPIIVERGKALDDRIKDVDRFFETMELDEESNVCFGEGGAGAFSDGKLNTNNKDKTGIYKFVLETFVKFGADEKILYENLPHIGTDKLVDVIKNIRNEILRLGGEIHYNTKLTFENGFAKLSPTSESFTSTSESIDTKDEAFSIKITKDTPIILAIGNSSRDTFKELIENGFDLKAKAIAVGYRIAHRQSNINESQYGKVDMDVIDLLGPATYKLTYDVGNGHSVYSFCMCPGGYIINSSNKKGMLSINGMSYNDRSGKYANSAIVETVKPEDVSRMGDECSPLQMIEFQERVERVAFELEKGFVPYVVSGASNICNEEVFKGQAKYCEKLKSVYEECGLSFDVNCDIEKALKHFNKIIPGFYNVAHTVRDNESLEVRDNDFQYVLAGVETRTSSPVKLDRDENYMCNIPNFYPCGEGLGHGGGIMSCAVDGINVAMSIVRKML